MCVCVREGEREAGGVGGEREAGGGGGEREAGGGERVREREFVFSLTNPLLYKYSF